MSGKQHELSNLMQKNASTNASDGYTQPSGFQDQHSKIHQNENEAHNEQHIQSEIQLTKEVL